MTRLPGSRESAKLKPPPLEKHFQARVVKKLKTLKNTWFVKISDRAKSGIPDIIACVNGDFVAIELKRSRAHEPTPLQQHTLGEIYSANGVAYTACPENWDALFENLIDIAGGLKGDK